MLKIKHKYPGVVRPGSELFESQSGTLGFRVQLECEDGDTYYDIWLTGKNKERARKVFVEALGVDPEQLPNANYLDMQLGLDIAGREVTFVTEEEEYNGKKRVKVAWLFKRSVSNRSPAKAAASFFQAANAHGQHITDEDIPF